MDHLHFHEVSVLQSDSSIRSQWGEVADAVVRDTQVGNAIPANTTAITQEALIRTNS